MPTRVILDCDNACGLVGRDVDDALALAYLLGRVDVEVARVTCTFGNAPLTAVVACTERLLARAARGDVPVHAGAATPGDHHTPAAAFLAETVAAAPGEIVVIATGPLTNVAAAARRDRSFFANVRAIHCMGGYFGAQRIGLRAAGELNLSADADATYAVFEGGADVVLFGTEVCRQLPLRLRDLRLLSGIDATLRRHVVTWLGCYGASRMTDRIFLWDVLPALGVTHPEHFGSHVRGARPDPASLADGRVVLTRPEGRISAPQTLSHVAMLRRDISAAWRRALPATRGKQGASALAPIPANSRTRATHRGSRELV